MICSGPCNQGRQECPTPDACEIPDSSSMEMLGVIAVYIVGMIVGAGMAGIVIWVFTR